MEQPDASDMEYPSFRVRLNNKNAVRAITSLDQVKFADAYLAGDIDIDGDMLRPFELRQWHWQINWRRNIGEPSDGERRVSCCLVDTDLLSPNSECLGLSTAIICCSHEMASWSKVAIDHRVCR